MEECNIVYLVTGNRVSAKEEMPLPHVSILALLVV